MEPIFRNPPIDKVEAVSIQALSESLDWSVNFLGIPPLWQQSQGEGVVVAVLDTGCDLDHPDLQGAVIGSRDFTGSLSGVRDRSSHGTWCASAIGARKNDIGFCGIAPLVKLLIGKVLGDDGSGGEAGIIAGIQWADAQGANIISMSLGGPSMSMAVLAAIRAFLAKPHRFIICAAGNDGRANSVGYPAKWEETVAVAAIDERGMLTSFSSRGPEVDIAAPGANMIAAVPVDMGSYARMSGTCIAEGEYVYTPQGPRCIEQINAGDVVYAQKDGKVVERVVYASHDRGTAEVHRMTAAGRDVLATASHEMLAFNTKRREPEWVRLGQITDVHRVLIPRRLASQVNPYLDALLSKDFCWLAGFFTGDGWISYTNRGFRTSFASGDKQDVIDKVCLIYEQIVGKQLRQNKSGTWHYDDCTKMAMIIDSIGLNSPANSKTVPLWLWSLSEAKQIAFYKGYRTADGHVAKAARCNGISDSFECSSGDLVRRIACLADYRGWKHGSVGKRSRFTKAPSSKAAAIHESHSLNVYRKPVASGWQDAIGCRDHGDIHRRALDAGVDTTHFATAPVRILERYSRQSRVFDLTVPDADCFITQGLVTHNSMATPVVAGITALCLSKHMKEGGLTGLETWQDLLAHLRKTAKDAGPVGPDTGYGYGIIDPGKLLADIAPVTPPVTPTPEGPDVQVTARDAKGQLWVSTKIDWKRAG